MIDRYTKAVLTVIAGALVYLCVAVTAFPAAHAQAPSIRPGDISKEPLPVVVTDLQLSGPLPVAVSNPVLRVTGAVTTERTAGAADRVILVGWEENAVHNRASRLRTINSTAPGFPVQQK